MGSCHHGLFVAVPNWRRSWVQVRARLEDNLDTPGAMSALDKLMSAVNKYLRKVQPGHARGLLLRDAALVVKRMLYVFGESFDASAALSALCPEPVSRRTGRQEIWESKISSSYVYE